MLLPFTRLASQYPRLQLQSTRPSIILPTCAQKPLFDTTHRKHFATSIAFQYHAWSLSRKSRPTIPSSSLVPATMIQLRAHAGHSHGHGHSHDNAYLVSANKNDAGVKITRIGLYVNLGMAITKGFGGWAFNSQALVADAFHALTDLVSDFMTLATISWSLRPPSEKFPFGYGKVESLGALGVSGLLVFGGVAMGANGMDALYTQFLADYFHGEHVHDEHVHGLLGGLGHSHSHAHLPPSLNAAWLAAGSIVIKEWLYRATMKVAKEKRSSVLASNAVHHRVDSLTSIVALATIAGSHIISNASWLDPVGGLIISLMVIRAGLGNTWSALQELVDVTIDDELKTNIRKSASKALKGNAETGLKGIEQGELVQIGDIQGTKSGQNYLIDLDLAVPATFTVLDTVPIEKAVRDRLGRKIRGVRRVRIKFTTQEESQDFASEFIRPDINPLGSPEVEGDHDHDHDHDHSHHNHGHETQKSK